MPSDSAIAECRDELGAVAIAERRGDRAAARRGALRLDRAVRRLRAALDRTARAGTVQAPATETIPD